MALLLDPVSVEREAAVTDIAKIAAFLQDALGQKITAYLGGLRDAKVVGRWVRGQVDPRDMVKMRLRSGYQAARMIVEAYGPGDRQGLVLRVQYEAGRRGARPPSSAGLAPPMTCSASSPPRGRSPERATEWGAPTWPPTPPRRSEAPRPSRGAPRPPDSFTGSEIAEGCLAPRPCRGASRLCSPRALQLEPSLRRPPARVPHALLRGSPDHVPARGAGRSATQRHGLGRVRPRLRRLGVDPGRRDLAGMAAAPRARPRVHRSPQRRARRSRRYPVSRTARSAARSAPRRARHRVHDLAASHVGPARSALVLGERGSALKDVWAVAVLFLFVMGGIYGGLFTATEGAGMGAMGALAFAVSAARSPGARSTTRCSRARAPPPCCS